MKPGLTDMMKKKKGKNTAPPMTLPGMGNPLMGPPPQQSLRDVTSVPMGPAKKKFKKV